MGVGVGVGDEDEDELEVEEGLLVLGGEEDGDGEHNLALLLLHTFHKL